MDTVITFPYKDSREIISQLKQDGFYRQTGNARMFFGPTGERLTVFNPGMQKRFFTSYGSGFIHHPMAKIVVTNTQDEDMVIKDLSLMIGQKETN